MEANLVHRRQMVTMLRFNSFDGVQYSLEYTEGYMYSQEWRRFPVKTCNASTCLIN